MVVTFRIFDLKKLMKSIRWRHQSGSWWDWTQDGLITASEKQKCLTVHFLFLKKSFILDSEGVNDRPVGPHLSPAGSSSSDILLRNALKNGNPPFKDTTCSIFKHQCVVFTVIVHLWYNKIGTIFLAAWISGNYAQMLENITLNFFKDWSHT